MFVITANRLDNGLVVYQTAVGGWTTSIADAQVQPSVEAVAVALEAAVADVKAQIVLDPYSVPVSVTDGVPVPHQFRERIRAEGPTVAFAVAASDLAGNQQPRKAA